MHLDPLTLAFMMLSAFLGGVIAVPLLKELNAAAANWWIANRIAKEQLQWNKRRGADVREALR